jgi:predicted NBD/HSP70 family sugar kinase
MTDRAQSSSIRGANRAAVLRVLQRGPAPRTRIVERTGLSAPTVARIVTELLDSGVVRELVAPAGTTQRRVGRPATDVELVADARWVLGLTIGMGTAYLAVTDLRGQVVRHAEVPFDATHGGVEGVREVGARTRRLLAGLGPDRSKLIGVGATLPGPVDAVGRELRVGVLHGWGRVPVADLLEEALGLPVTVDHLVRAMAVAEAHLGHGVDDDDVAFVFAHIGVGAGLVRDREPLTAAHGAATEIGHLQVDPDGRPCACGNQGCLETVVSLGALAEAAAALRERDPHGPVALALDGGSGPVDALAAAADGGDRAAAALLERTGALLGTAVVTLVNLFTPTLVVLGGPVGETPRVVQAVRDAVARKAFPVVRDAVRVETTSFGRLAVPIGAAAVALEQFFYRPAPSREADQRAGA